jgi:hypothetical protein
MAVALLLAPHWPGTFRRTIRNEAGEVIRRVEFPASVPVVLEDDEFIAIADDVGKSLVYAAIGDKGEPLSKPAVDQGNFDDLKPKGKKKK